MQRYSIPRTHLGPSTKKVLLLLAAGVALGLTTNPTRQFRIVRSFAQEWKRINHETLRRAIRQLYASKLIDMRHNNDGTTSVILTENGKAKTLQYNLDRIAIQKQAHWDGVWRLVIFDIPEHKKQARDALSAKLKQLGFRAVQKSVFIHPQPCKNVIDFLVEIFGVRPYVRQFLVKETDIDLDLRHYFHLD